MNSAMLLDKGMKCLTNELGLLEAEQFVFTLLSQPFDYTEWRKNNLCAGMNVAEVSAAADRFCRENPAVAE
ncbi:MAG: hypothetical protein LBK76_03620 [Verrucomicrobiales bacterium]|jgi:hypothetical protein|nr:hypothetical protein [Verrucomicrobiales bacterium]